MRLTLHFSLEELIRSKTANIKKIDNIPPQQVIPHLRVLAEGLEQVRAILDDNPITVNSGYRSPRLNAAVGGSRNSAHMSGFAADFVCPRFGTPIEIVRKITASSLNFDQLIQEGSWVHISFEPRMRREVLTAIFAGGRTTYRKGYE